MGEQVETWNTIFVFVLSQRLPKDSFEMWEQSVSSIKIFPQLSALEMFLENRRQTLITLESRFATVSKSHAAIAKAPIQSATRSLGLSNPPASVTNSTKCDICTALHQKYKCPKLIAIPVSQRWLLVQSNQLCVLCFNKHLVESCTLNH